MPPSEFTPLPALFAVAVLVPPPLVEPPVAVLRVAVEALPPVPPTPDWPAVPEAPLTPLLPGLRPGPLTFNADCPHAADSAATPSGNRIKLKSGRIVLRPLRRG